MVEKIVEEEGQQVLVGWRKVPTNNFYLGETARDAEPSVRQLFIGRNSEIKTDLDFERKLYVIRRRAAKAIEKSDLTDKEYFYIPSLSSRTLIYKGMLTSTQLKDFIPTFLTRGSPRHWHWSTHALALTLFQTGSWLTRFDT